MQGKTTTIVRVAACSGCRIKILARYGGERKPVCPQCGGPVVALRRENMTSYATFPYKRQEDLMAPLG